MLKGHFAANSLCGKYDAKKKAEFIRENRLL